MASEDPIAHHELEALSRRTAAVEDRVEALQVQSGGNFAAVIEGQAALRREVRDGFTAMNARIDALTDEVRTGNAQIIELLSRLVGKNPDAS
ncbi:hypothetical protein ACH4GK_37965 [Streptomyces rimosus]|uniref:hypothetical protein n=1 Tax=Streptomyces rimosus TaxID=1927 RepID=UPI0004C5224F|nr:hypothetical protein [Streptomyces rimosus]